MRNSKNTLSWIVVALALSMVGCMGASEPSDSSSDELLAADGGQLGSLEEDDWEGALPGCDGILEGDESFAIASAEYGLVAALGADGAILCVDTVEAVEDELEETGHVEEADDLVSAYAATIRALDMAGDPNARFQSRDHEGDPDPQPNSGWTRFQQAGDPDPQPNSGM